jgi:GTP cyclohydrolase IA
LSSEHARLVPAAAGKATRGKTENLAPGNGASGKPARGRSLGGSPPAENVLQTGGPAPVTALGSPELGPDEIDEVESDRLGRSGGRSGGRIFTAAQLQTIEQGVRLILTGLGEDLERDGIRMTPARVARMYADLCSGHSFVPTTFANTQGYSEMVLVRGIQFYSLCEHHLMPFFGTATVAYIPGDRILGLSKLGRVVEQYARQLQLQEQLTEQIANQLDLTLAPRGVAVFIKAEHLCMSARGIEKPGHQTHTFALHGVFKEEPYRTEFLRQSECFPG